MVFILLKVFSLERSMAKAFALTFKLMVGVANGNPKKHGFQIILAGSRNPESSFDKSRFACFFFLFWSLKTFYQGVSGWDLQLGSQRLGKS